MDLFEDPAPPAPPQGNQPEFTVSELSGAVKRVIEGEFGLVRVRGEVGRVSRPASGIFILTSRMIALSSPRFRGRGRLPACRCVPRKGWKLSPRGG